MPLLPRFSNTRRVDELIDTIVALWEDAEHDYARNGMLLTLRQDLGYNLPSKDEELPSSEELRAALAEGPAHLERT